MRKSSNGIQSSCHGNPLQCVISCAIDTLTQTLLLIHSGAINLCHIHPGINYRYSSEYWWDLRMPPSNCNRVDFWLTQREMCSCLMACRTWKRNTIATKCINGTPWGLKQAIFQTCVSQYVIHVSKWKSIDISYRHWQNHEIQPWGRYQHKVNSC